MITDVVDEWWKIHAHAPHLTLPGGVFDKYGPNCENIDTPTDHRMLWWVRDQLLGVHRTPAVGEIFDLLNTYLGATCQHHWMDYPAEDGALGAHRQCLWCNEVEWTVHAPITGGETLTIRGDNYDDTRCELCFCLGVDHRGPEYGGRCEAFDGWGDPCSCPGFELPDDDGEGSLNG